MDHRAKYETQNCETTKNKHRESFQYVGLGKEFFMLYFKNMDSKKNGKIGLHQTKKILHRKGNSKHSKGKIS
jgi:hypothetical protein